MNYKAIIFDFYGVTCSEIGGPWYKKHSTENRGRELKDQYDKPSNLGVMSESEFFSNLGQQSWTTAEQVRKEWTDAVVINMPLVSLIRKLRPAYKIALCSNTQPQLFRQILGENNLEELFDVIVSSSEVHLAKPNPEIFKITLSKLNVSPSEAIFIDDKPENVEAATAIGIRSLLYTDFETLQKDFGVLN